MKIKIEAATFCSPLFHNLGTLPLEKILEKDIVSIMNRVFVFHKPVEFHRYFNLHDPVHTYALCDMEPTFEVPVKD